MRDWASPRSRPINLDRLRKILEQHRGAARAIRTRDLVVLLALEESFPDRTIRQGVNALIEAGVPVGSTTHDPSGAGGGGYYLITSESELAACIGQLRSRARELERRAQRLELAHRVGPPQPRLFDDADSHRRPDGVRGGFEGRRGGA